MRDRLAAVTDHSVVGEEFDDTTRSRGRRVPLDHRPDRRHQELRPRRADLGDAARPRTRGRPRARRGVGARAAARGGGRHAGWVRSATATASACRRCRRSTDAQISFAWDSVSSFDGERHRRSDARTFAALLAHSRPRRLLAAPAGCRRRVRHRDRSDRVAVGRRRARADRRGGRRTLEHDRRPRRSPTAAASCARTAACTTTSSRRSRRSHACRT